jgi:hypothetical protein
MSALGRSACARRARASNYSIPKNALKPFLAADVDKQLQNASSQPLSLEAITDFYGELCLRHTVSPHQSARADNLGFLHLRLLHFHAGCSQS